MKEDIIKMFEDALKIRSLLIDAENPNIASILDKEFKRIQSLKMINEAESSAKEIDNKDIKDFTVNVRNAGVTLANIIMFDDEDANVVGINNIIRLVNALEKFRVYFNQIAIKQRNRLQNMINDLKVKQENNAGTDNDIDENLTKLTKEELIALLRKKNK